MTEHVPRDRSVKGIKSPECCRLSEYAALVIAVLQMLFDSELALEVAV